jgi:hypothetical protein
MYVYLGLWEIGLLMGSQIDTRTRYDAVYHTFHLAEILYLPQDGRGEGLVGEELLDWVNDVDTGRYFTAQMEVADISSTEQRTSYGYNEFEESLGTPFLLAIHKSVS